jgi:hypothetical protein
MIYRQRGGTVIHDVDTDVKLPNITYAPTLDLPELSMAPLTSALDTYAKIKDQEFKTIRENMNALNKVYDDVTKVRYDNDLQKEAIDQAKAKAGLDDSVLNLNPDQLKNPYIMAPISRAASSFTNDPKVREVLREQAWFDTQLAAAAKSPPSNPELQGMFMEDIKAYQEGRLSGTSINIGQYEDHDIGADLGKRMKELPPIKTSELVDDPYVTYEQQVTARSKQALIEVVSERLSDPKFRNNMIAKGFMDREGNLTQKGSNYIDSVSEAYAAEQIDILGLKHKPKHITQYGRETNPAASVELKGITGALYNSAYQMGATYGIPLDDPNYAALNMTVLSQIKNAEKDSAQGISIDAAGMIKNTLRKEAIRVGHGAKALYDAAVERGFAGTQQDFIDILTLNDGTSMSTGTMGELYAPVWGALGDIVGKGNETHNWDRIRNNMTGAATGQSAQPPQPTPQPGGVTLSGLLSNTAPQVTQGYSLGYDRESFLDITKSSEAGGNANAQNPNSSALGPYQFVEGTWLGLVGDERVAHHFKGKSREEILALRTDETVARDVARVFADRNATALRSKGYIVTNETMYLAHHLGSGGANKFLTALSSDPTTKMASLGIPGWNTMKDYRDLKTGKYVRDMTVLEFANYQARKSQHLIEGGDQIQSRHYTASDFNLGQNDFIRKSVVNLLDEASALAGFKLPVSSTYRSSEKNASVGGSLKSQHLGGYAVDIPYSKLKTDQEKAKALEALIDAGASYLIVEDDHIHADMRVKPIKKVGIRRITKMPQWAKEVLDRKGVAYG